MDGMTMLENDDEINETMSRIADEQSCQLQGLTTMTGNAASAEAVTGQDRCVAAN